MRGCGGDIIIEETQIHRAAEDRNRPLPPDFFEQKMNTLHF